MLTTATPPPETPRKSLLQRLIRRPRSWKFYAAIGVGVPMAILAAFMGYYYVVFSRMIDARIHGQMQRTDPRVFARPFELQRGQAVTPRQLVDRLNDLGYAHRTRSEQPGEFTEGRDALVLIPREGDRKGQQVRAVFGRRGKTAERHGIERLELLASKKTVERIRLDAPL